MSIKCSEYSWERALTADVQNIKMQGSSHKRSQLGIRLKWLRILPAANSNQGKDKLK
jgi:hypothetical protein